MSNSKSLEERILSVFRDLGPECQETLLISAQIARLARVETLKEIQKKDTQNYEQAGSAK